MDRSWRARLRYKADGFLASGPGKQLLILLFIAIGIVLIHTLIALALSLPVGDRFDDKMWFYFARIMDGGSMAGDVGRKVRIVSIVDTILGVIVAGLLISALAGNFQNRLESIRHTGSPVIEDGHFLILGWSEKIYSVIDQLSEANLPNKIVVVVMADRDKVEMEDMLRDKLTHLDRVKVVVRSGSSVSVTDLSKVSLSTARSVVVLLDETDGEDRNKADGRVIKTLMALYNHPDAGKTMEKVRITAEVMLPQNQEIAEIASGGHAQVLKTNEIISKIILQTSRIPGLSLVYDELLRFEGNEIHYAHFPEVVGKQFGDILLDFPNGCLVGTGKVDGSAHQLNPPADYVIAKDDELLILAEDDNILYQPRSGSVDRGPIQVTAVGSHRPIENLLVLGWNEKVFPIVSEFDSYVGAGSKVTLVSNQAKDDQDRELAEHCGELKHVTVTTIEGEFTSRALMGRLEPTKYPAVMVLGDTVGGGGAEEADTRAIIALLLLRDFRKRAGIVDQEVCSEILNPKNRELAQTTEIHDIVISNEMVSMVLAQVTHEPRVRAVLEDLFQSEGSEIYLKTLDNYVKAGETVSFEQLVVAAKQRGEVAMGLHFHDATAAQRYGMELNPKDRQKRITPKHGDRLVVMAEDDG